MPEGAPGSAWGDLGLGLFSHEPVQEALQGEEFAAVYTLSGG